MKSVFRKSLCLLLAILTVICLFSACSVKSVSVETIKTNNKIIPAQFISGDCHTPRKESFSLLAQSGTLKLYFDSKTASVIVYDEYSDFYWSALPVFGSNLASMIGVTVLSEKGKYILNSQDNSVAFSSYTAEFIDDGIKITYNMSDSASTAEKGIDAVSEGELLVSVPVEIKLTDGDMYVSVINKDVFVSKGYVLETVSVLPYFGALSYKDGVKQTESEFSLEQSEQPSAAESEEKESEQPAEKEAEEEKDGISSEPDEAKIYTDGKYNDFMLLPDGCGAVIYTAVNEPSNENLSFKVYSNDDLSDSLTAQIPAYGIKKDGCAFVAVIDENAESATVKATRSVADPEDVNRVGVEFRYTATASQGLDTCYRQVGEEASVVCFRFLSGGEANYIGMAAACREHLIRTGKLPAEITNYGELPLNVAVVTTVNGGYSTKVSDFEEAEDMLSVLKGKGINSVNMIMQGAFPGGLMQNSSHKAKPLKKAGGKNAFDSMCEYAGKQQFKVFAGLNILGTSSNSQAALTLAGEKVTAETVNPLAPYVGKKSYETKLLARDRIEENVISLLDSARKLGVSGYCINDAARYSYGDYSGEKAGASETAETVAENLVAFSVHKDLMLDGCNFNVIKNASFLLNVPFRTQNHESDSYRAVPFIPAVLHASVGYSGPASNTAALPKLEMLKTVEYGGIPYCLWTFSSESHLYYQTSLSETVDFSLRVNRELSDLSSARITGHRVIQNGLFVTEFDTGSQIYVNYNNFSVPIGNITVPPYDYIRIN